MYLAPKRGQDRMEATGTDRRASLQTKRGWQRVVADSPNYWGGSFDSRGTLVFSRFNDQFWVKVFDK